MAEKLLAALGVGVAVFGILWKLVGKFGGVLLDELRADVKEHGHDITLHASRISVLEDKVREIEEECKINHRRKR